MSRVDAAKIAVEKAGDRAEGAVAASDAFMPFPDSLEVCAEAASQRSSSRAARCATRR